jgi:hypothetical protein
MGCLVSMIVTFSGGLAEHLHNEASWNMADNVKGNPLDNVYDHRSLMVSNYSNPADTYKPSTFYTWVMDVVY